ncbi:serine protease inhibitor [Sinomonas halotolerans]|uniref:Serine protease inhibitor n=1 Tax=Sinomonas halotolerans TaxID=1644133 RepID=A0ABU9WXT9_9MICC
MKTLVRIAVLAAPALASVLFLAACGSPAPPAGASPSSDGEPTAELTVVVVRAPGEPEQEWMLTCDGLSPLPGSTHPTAAEACALIHDRPEVLSPPDPHQACTEQYGGPDVARVTGTLRGAPVDRTFDRTNGCGISSWDASIALIGEPGGAV